MIRFTYLARPAHRLLACLLVTLCQAVSVQAEEFAASTEAMEELHSRDFDSVDARSLLLASLAVIQDMKFQVTESHIEPGLIVAQSGQGGLASPVLTLSVQKQPGKSGVYRVLLSAAAHTQEATNPMDYGDFHQDFFTHLQRELFKQRTGL